MPMWKSLSSSDTFLCGLIVGGLTINASFLASGWISTALIIMGIFVAAVFLFVTVLRYLISDQASKTHISSQS